MNGVNYLIPVDATLARDVDVEDEAVSLDPRSGRGLASDAQPSGAVQIWFTRWRRAATAARCC